MNKKGFTLIELLGVVVILGLLITLATGAYQNYLNSAEHKAFAIAEKNFISATRDAYIDCFANDSNKSFCRNHPLLETKNEQDTIYLNELVTDGYIDEIKNPYNVDEFCSSHASYVVVMNPNNSNQINYDFDYEVCLICGSHKSAKCK